MLHLLNLRQQKLSHIQHALLGLAIILVSIVLLCNDYYFFYPPYLAGFLNDDAIGALGLILGVNLIVWAYRDKNNVRVNFWQLIFSCSFWAFEATAEFMHGVHAGRPHMITVGCLEVIMFLWTLSVIEKSPKIKRKDSQD